MSSALDPVSSRSFDGGIFNAAIDHKGAWLTALVIAIFALTAASLILAQQHHPLHDFSFLDKVPLGATIALYAGGGVLLIIPMIKLGRYLSSTEVAAVPDIEASKEIREKLQTAKQAIQFLKNNSSRTWPAEIAADRAAVAFFERAQSKLDRGENVCLPEVFHATKTTNSIKSILTSGAIWMQPGCKGRGAYVSTRDEIQYGLFTFAIDLKSLQNTSAIFFSAGEVPQDPLQRRPVWVSVDENIQVNETSIAYLVIPVHEDHAAFQQEMSQTYPWLCCIDRPTSDRIRQALNTVAERHLPKHWEQSTGQGDRGLLPEGVIWDGSDN